MKNNAELLPEIRGYLELADALMDELRPSAVALNAAVFAAALRNVFSIFKGRTA